jgi:predicted transposase YbfD/YdcC
VACAEKSNEITAIPELLRLVDIKGAIITIDAMGTQKAIVAQIIEGEADYVLALKGNHETLHQAVIDYIDEQCRNDFVGVNARRHQTREAGHGREERRRYVQMPVPRDLPGVGLWRGLKSIGVVESRCVRNGKETVEVRYSSNKRGSSPAPLVSLLIGRGRTITGEALRPRVVVRSGDSRVTPLSAFRLRMPRGTGTSGSRLRSLVASASQRVDHPQEHPLPLVPRQ